MLANTSTKLSVANETNPPHYTRQPTLPRRQSQTRI